MDGQTQPAKGSKANLKPLSKTKEGHYVNLMPKSANQTFMIDTSSLLGKTRLSEMGETVRNSSKGETSQLLNFTMDNQEENQSDGSWDDGHLVRQYYNKLFYGKKFRASTDAKEISQDSSSEDKDLYEVPIQPPYQMPEADSTKNEPYLSAEIQACIDRERMDFYDIGEPNIRPPSPL